MNEPSATRLILEQLLAQRGIGSFALFLTQQEGTMLPGDIEALSGFVLDDRERVFRFWLDWSTTDQRYTLNPFTRVYAPSTKFARDPDYQAARESLHLAPTT